MNSLNNVNFTKVNQFSTQENGIRDVMEFNSRQQHELPVYYNEKFNIKLTYKLILITKNHQNILSKAIHDKIKYLISSQLNNWNVVLVAYEEAQNNSQITFTLDPNLNLHTLITEFKQFTSEVILKTFATALSTHKLKQSIWEDGYFLRSVGENADSEIKQYTQPKKRENYLIHQT